MTYKGDRTMKRLKVKLTFTEPILGTCPSNPDIYRDYVARKAPSDELEVEELEALGEMDADKGMTVFPRLPDGTPFLYDYHIKGFLKDACSGLRRVSGTKSSKLKAYKKEIDRLIFPQPRCIRLDFDGEVTDCQRPLRAQTPKGERVSLAISEEIPAGATCEFSIVCLCDEHEDYIREWLDYGAYSGIGQWRNSGKGRFTWNELPDA